MRNKFIRNFGVKMHGKNGIKLEVSPEDAVKAVEGEIKKGKEKRSRVPIPDGSRSFILGDKPTIAMAWHSESVKTLKTVFNDSKFVRGYELLGKPTVPYSGTTKKKQFEYLRSYYTEHIEYLEKALTLINKAQSDSTLWGCSWLKNAAIGEFMKTPIGLTCATIMVICAIIGVVVAILNQSPIPTSETIVDFPDPQVALQIREQINKPSGDIYKDDLLPLTELILSESTIMNIWGLENCVNLQSLSLYGGKFTDITPVGNLTKLTNLTIYGNKISDVSALQYLTELRELSLTSPEITDISFLRPLVKLEVLVLPDQIQNIDPLRGLTRLTNLSLGITTSDISPLQNLTELKILRLTGSEISDISPIGYLIGLEDLTIRKSQLHDLHPIKSLTNLWHLRFVQCFVGDLESIQSLPNLTYLIIQGSQLEDLSALRDLLALTELHLDSNCITNIEPLRNLVSLEILYLRNNEIEDISPLEFLLNIKELHLESNQIQDISPLVRNQGIGSGDLVCLDGNPFNSLSEDTYKPALQSRGVQVQ